jgi:hypothetical protein
MTNEFSLATWTCAHCGQSSSERVHPKTDGNLENLAPPAGWTLIENPQQYALICPRCSEKHKVAAAQHTTTIKTDETIAGIAYRVIADWCEQHICLHCANKTICKCEHTNPLESPIYPTITRCKAFRTLTE